MTTEPIIVGIDLGTTNSLVARWSVDAPALIPNVFGDMLTPSVVGIDLEGRLLVGRPARELQILHPERCASAFKRHMGTDWKTRLGEREFGPVELSSLVLRSLKADAESHLGQPITHAVITVPAYFNEHQRQATIRAGELAGLTVRRILNEPTAAAIAYGIHEANQDSVFLVFDLGGGTFDVSIMDRFEGALEIRSSSGEIFLGGEDFTGALVSRVLQSQNLIYERVEHESPRMVSRLRRECEMAKRALARDEQATVRVPGKDGELPEGGPTVTIRRAEFETWTESLLARTEISLRRALGDAKLRRQDIQDVILVGGATRMAAVRSRVESWFNRTPRCSLNPDEVVALGAAVQAGLVGKDRSLSELVVTDVAPFTLGVETCHVIGRDLRPGYFMPVINRNTTIPVSRVERVSTVAPNQTSVRVRLYQGEARRVQDNIPLGEFEVEGIPRGPAGQEIDIRFTYDQNGVLEAEATVVATGKSVRHVVTRHAKGLSPAQIEEAVRKMQELKSHPREEQANRMLLLRAERIYQELPLAQRDLLDQLLHGFEEALAMQDPSAIETNRETLTKFLNMFDAPDGERQDF